MAGMRKHLSRCLHDTQFLSFFRQQAVEPLPAQESAQGRCAVETLLSGAQHREAGASWECRVAKGIDGPQANLLALDFEKIPSGSY